MGDISLENIIQIYESDLHEYISERLDTQRLHIIICRQGYAIFSFNQKKRAVSAGCLLVVSSDIITTVVRTSSNFKASYIDISNDIVLKATLSVSPDLITALYYNPIIKLDKTEFDNLQQWLNQFRWSLEKVPANRAAHIIRNNLQSLTFVLETLYPYDRYTDIKGLSSQNKIYIDFCILVCEMCKREHSVQFYADKLCITPYYLSRITARMAGITPKRIIDEQLIAETKHILLHTELTIKEISDTLFFDSTSYFCKFFKKYTGESPAGYRERHN